MFCLTCLVSFPAVETLSHLEVSDVLPSCPYSPSYLLSRKLEENEAFVKGYVGYSSSMHLKIQAHTGFIKISEKEIDYGFVLCQLCSTDNIYSLGLLASKLFTILSIVNRKTEIILLHMANHRLLVFKYRLFT